MFYLYNMITSFVAPILHLALLFLSLRDKERRPEYHEKFGYYQTPKKSSKKRIWIHAVSVGEILLARPLIKKFIHHADAEIFLSTTNKEAHKLAQKTLTDRLTLIFFPYDFFWVIRRAYDAIQPSFIVILEVEIWPNFIREAVRRNIHVYMANGIINEKEFRNYKLFRFFFAPLLCSYKKLLMQRRIDLQRVIELGAAHDHAVLAGNMKYDVTLPKPTAKTALLKKILGVRHNILIITAASTHPGEEKIIIESFLNSNIKNSRLIIAPRHPARTPEICNLISNVPFAIRSKGNSTDAKIIILDTIGELIDVFRFTDIVFMGGTYTWEGHNIIEPGLLKKAIVTGPRMKHFSEIFEDFKNADALEVAANPGDLHTYFYRLARSKKRRDQLGENAYRTIQKNRGVTKHIYDIIIKCENQKI